MRCSSCSRTCPAHPMPRAGLSRAAVVDLALAVVDDVGFDQLTLAAVAARAGVAVPSLYKHVSGLADLRREVALGSVRELTAVLDAAAPGTPTGALGRTADAVRDFARRTPGRYLATQVARDADDPGDAELVGAATEAVQAMAAALRPVTGALGGAALVDAVRAVRSAVHGFVMLELTGGFGMPEDVDASFAYLIRVLEAGLAATQPDG